jgi:hypothetical protein
LPLHFRRISTLENEEVGGDNARVPEPHHFLSRVISQIPGPVFVTEHIMPSSRANCGIDSVAAGG